MAGARTLKDPKFLTEQASFTLRPAGAVMFSISSVNSGSSDIAVKKKGNSLFDLLGSLYSTRSRSFGT